jgi:predicted nucleic acid-binding protein
MFLNSSIIVEIITSEPGSPMVEKIFSHIENENLYISIIQLGELSDWCLKNAIDPMSIIPNLKNILTIHPLEERTILAGSVIKRTRRDDGHTKFTLLDGIIFASSRELNEKLLTMDQDFTGMENVVVLT